MSAADILRQYAGVEPTNSGASAAGYQNAAKAQTGLNAPLTEDYFLNPGTPEEIIARTSGYNRYVEDASAERTRGEHIGDNALSATDAAISSLMGVAGLTAGLVNDEAGATVAGVNGVISDSIRSFKSDGLAARMRAKEARTAETDARSEQLYREDLAKGESTSLAGWRKAGRDILDTFANMDSETVEDSIASGIGSFAVGGAVGKGLQKLGLGARTSMAASIGAQEGGGAYSQTTQEIMGMSDADLMQNSPAYRELIDSGMSSDEARIAVANRGGLTSAAIAAPVGAATGALLSAGEGKLFRVGSLKQGLAKPAVEGVEEFGQSGASQYATNVGVSAYADDTRDLMSDVAKQATEGAVAGAGTGAVMGAPGTAKQLGVETAKLAVKAVMGAGRMVRGAIATRMAGIDEELEAASPVSAEQVDPVYQAVLGRVSDPAVREQLEAKLAERAADTANRTTTEQVPNVLSHFDRLKQAMTLDPAEADNVNSPVIADAIRGSTDKFDALRKIAAIAADENQPIADRIHAGMYLHNAQTNDHALVASLNEAIELTDDADPVLAPLREMEDVILSFTEVPQIRSAIEAGSQLAAKLEAKNVAADKISTPEGLATVQAAASVAAASPLSGNLDVVNGVLQNARSANIDLTEQQFTALAASAALLTAAKAHADTIQTAGLKKSMNAVSGEIRSDLIEGKQLSSTGHTRQIMRAMAAGDMEAARRSLANFMGFAESMQNKVVALNKHLELQNKEGQFYQTRDGAGEMKRSSKPLMVHPTKDGSVDLAQSIANDARVVVTMANVMATAYPDLGIAPIEKVDLDNRLTGNIKDVTFKFREAKRTGAAVPKTETKPIVVDPPVTEVAAEKRKTPPEPVDETQAPVAPVAPTAPTPAPEKKLSPAEALGKRILNTTDVGKLEWDAMGNEALAMTPEEHAAVIETTDGVTNVKPIAGNLLNLVNDSFNELEALTGVDLRPLAKRIFVRDAKTTESATYHFVGTSLSLTRQFVARLGKVSGSLNRVMSHELGHAMDWVLTSEGLASNDPMFNQNGDLFAEFSKLKQDGLIPPWVIAPLWSYIDESFKESNEEFFAELVSFVLLNPQLSKEVIPNGAALVQELLSEVAEIRGLTVGANRKAGNTAGRTDGSSTNEAAPSEPATVDGKVQLPGTGGFVKKDQAKSDQANKFIGRGSSKSSTNAYAKAWGQNANTGTYSSDDRVFISAEGNRQGRMGPNFAEINRAIAGGATLITDVAADRNRAYNTGEREVADHLLANGYVEQSPGVWGPAPAGAPAQETAENSADATEPAQTPTPPKPVEKSEDKAPKEKPKKLGLQDLAAALGTTEAKPEPVAPIGDMSVQQINAEVKALIARGLSDLSREERGRLGELRAELEARIAAANEQPSELELTEEDRVDPSPDSDPFQNMIDANEAGVVNWFKKTFTMVPGASRLITLGPGMMDVVRRALSSTQMFVQFAGKSSISGTIDQTVATAYSSTLGWVDMIADHMNARLERNLDKDVSKDSMTFGQALVFGGTKRSVNDMTRTKVFNVLDQNGDTIGYNTAVQGTSILAGLQWLIGQSKNRTMDDETLFKVLGIRTEDQVLGNVDVLAQEFSQGIDEEFAVRAMADIIRKFWGVRENKNAYVGFADGIPAAMAAEVLAAFENAGLIETYQVTVEFPLSEAEAAAEAKKPAKDRKRFRTQKYNRIRITAPADILAAARQKPDLLERLALTKPETVWHIGSPPPAESAATAQLRNRAVKNSAQQNAMISKYENTGFTPNMMMHAFFDMLGDNAVKLFGSASISDTTNVNHRMSLEGKNQTVLSAIGTMREVMGQLQNFADANGMDVKDVPVHYRFIVTKSGRLQMQGKNTPQASKLIRELLSPVRSTVDLSAGTKAESVFFLALAQHLGEKVHKVNRAMVEETILKRLADPADLAPAVKVIRDWVSDQSSKKPRALDDADIAVLTDALGEGMEPVAIHALVEYARYLNAVEAGALSNFETSMYVEADGISDGPINAMMLFGLGVLKNNGIHPWFTDKWIQVMAKGGMFLGNKRMSIADYMMSDEPGAAADTYEATTEAFRTFRQQLVDSAPAEVKAMSDHLITLMSQLTGGDVTIENGVMTIRRGIAKNPVTVTIYGSGANGITAKFIRLLSQEMYKQLSTPEGMSEEASDALRALTGSYVVLSKKGTWHQFASENFVGDSSIFSMKNNDRTTMTLTPEAIQTLSKNVSTLFVAPLMRAIDDTIGEVNPAMKGLQQATQVLSVIKADLFQKRVDALVAEKIEDSKLPEAERKWPGWRKGYSLTRGELDKIETELDKMFPQINSGTQAFDFSGSEYVKTGSDASYGLEDDFKTPLTVRGPVNAGVRAQSGLVQGAGDGSAIQIYATTPKAPRDLPVFDGINFGLNDVELGSELINKAVFTGWMKNPLGDVTRAYAEFRKNMTPEIFAGLSENSKRDLARAFDLELVEDLDVPSQLEDLAQRLSIMSQYLAARHTVLASVGMSVDHLASAEAPHVNEGIELIGSIQEKREQINELLKAELERRGIDATAFLEQVRTNTAPAGAATREPTSQTEAAPVREIPQQRDLQVRVNDQIDAMTPAEQKLIARAYKQTELNDEARKAFAQDLKFTYEKRPIQSKSVRLKALIARATEGLAAEHAKFTVDYARARNNVPANFTTEAVAAQIDALTAKEQKAVAEAYGQPELNDTARNNLEADVLQTIDNKPIRSKSTKLKNIIRKIILALGALSVVFSMAGLQPASMSSQAYASKVSVEQAATVPDEAKGGMSHAAQRAYEILVPAAMQKNKGLIIADKPAGMVHVFDKDGQLIVTSTALYGATKGDDVARAGIHGKVTPAGKYQIKFEDSDYAGGKLARLYYEGSDDGGLLGGMAIHSVYVAKPEENRIGRLATATAADNKISWGCINTSEQTFVQKIVPNIDQLEGATVFVVSENADNLDKLAADETAAESLNTPPLNKQNQLPMQNDPTGGLGLAGLGLLGARRKKSDGVSNELTSRPVSRNYDDHQSPAFGNSDRLTRIRRALRDKIAKHLVKFDPVQLVDEETKVQLASNKAGAVATQMIAKGFPNMTMQERTTFEMVVQVLATEAYLDPNSLARMGQLWDHVVANLKRSDFLVDKNDPDQPDLAQAQDKLDVILGNFGVQVDAQGRSSLMPAFMALAIVNDQFREVLRQMPVPRAERGPGKTLDGVFENFGTGAMERLDRRMSGDSKARNVREAVDSLTDQIAAVDAQAHDFVTNLSNSTSGVVGRLNDWAVEQMDSVALKAEGAMNQAKMTATHPAAKLALAIGTTITSLVNDERSGNMMMSLMSRANQMNLPKMMFDFFNEVVGRTDDNASIYDRIKIVRATVQKMRQQFRLQLPKTLAKQFSRKLTKPEWKALHDALAKTDIAALTGTYTPAQILEIVNDSSVANREMRKLEEQITASRGGGTFLLFKQKMEELAESMITGNKSSANGNFLSNAEAIARLLNERHHAMAAGVTPSAALVRAIDQYTTLLALGKISAPARATVRNLLTNEKQGVEFVVTSLIGQSLGEREKFDMDYNPRAMLNHYKGYVPTEPQTGVSLIVALDSESAKLRTLGYERVGDYKGSRAEGSTQKKGYYFAPVSSRAAFLQGILQTVRQSAYGVDPRTGYTTGPMIADRITEPQLVKAIQRQAERLNKGPEGLLPVFNEHYKVIAYERAVAPAQEARLGYNTHMGEVMGIWRGRQMEEILSQSMNKELISRLSKKWNDEKVAKSNEYIDLFSEESLKHPIIGDAVRLITPEARRQIAQVYEDGQFWVRKDSLDDVIGYRGISVGDAWTGTTTISPAAQKVMRDVATTVFGKNAYKNLVRAESVWQNFVADARVTIVIKSGIVPVANMMSNVLHKLALGVPPADIYRGITRKISETNAYLANELRRNELDAELFNARAKRDDKAIRKAEIAIQSIEDANRRLDIWPLIEAGEFTSINEAGIHPDDQMLTTGRLNDFIERAADKLPDSLKTAGRYAIVSQDTALFKALQRATQYGDFLSKAVLYDDITIRQGKSKAYALGRISEEFINFDRAPGRARSYLEGMGVLWFWHFKIRSIKVAMATLRNNPLQLLLTGMIPLPDLFGSIGSPGSDNLASIAAQGKLGWSMGPESAFRAYLLNPGFNILT